ncbi:MAG: glycosyltransferase family 87 protein [Chthoniobacteraceae bacterium]
MQNYVSDRPITKLQRIGLWALLALVFIFGGIVEYRSAFLTHRRTDADDFFRSGWGIRTGRDIYELVDTQGWHYNYPPFFAILITPLANPPPGADRAGYLPYEVSIAVWYALSVVALFYAVHWLASTLEEHLGGALSKKPAAGCARWWTLRVIPVLVCLPSIGRTLSRGQVNLFVLLLFCGIGIFTVKKRNTWAGIFIATAASIKLFPAYLGLYPLFRRDWKGVAGCFIGAFFCLAVVPLVALGPARTTECYRKFINVLVGPALTGGGDQSRANELLNATGTDSQSFLVIIHNTMHPCQPRPAHAARWVRPVHWVLSFLITAVTLWFGRYRRPEDALYNILFLGTMIVAMLPISPVSHTHYFVFALPLVMALVACSWERNQAAVLSRGYIILFAIHIAANVLSLPPSMALLKAVGLSFYGTIILWVAGLRELKARGEMQQPAPVIAG